MAWHVMAWRAHERFRPFGADAFERFERRPDTGRLERVGVVAGNIVPSGLALGGARCAEFESSGDAPEVRNIDLLFFKRLKIKSQHAVDSDLARSFGLGIFVSLPNIYRAESDMRKYISLISETIEMLI